MSDPDGQLRRGVLEDLLKAQKPKLAKASVVLADPELVEQDDAEWLLEHAHIAGVVVHPSLAKRNTLDRRVGAFIPEKYTWRLPAVEAQVLAFVGPRNQIGMRMVLGAIRYCGARTLVYGIPGLWRREHVLVFILGRVAERVKWGANRWTLSTRQRLVRLVPKGVIGLGARLWDRLPARAVIRLARFERAARDPLLRDSEFKPGECLLVNSALAWGGAERQLVNTLLGLSQRNISASLLCEHLHVSEDHRFFSGMLDGMSVRALGTEGISSLQGIDRDKREKLTSAVEVLPPEIREDVFRYAVHFMLHRPSVVHAWQDATSIKAGLAALLVGVPRIVLSGRNVSPIRFAYYQYYMRAAYRVLAASPRVLMTNNSNAGARDYERWLGITGIQVIRNGLAANFMSRPSDSEVDAYRETLGIPGSGRTVGAVFRLYEEKDPALWVRAAAELGRRRDDLWFLLVGTGPLNDELRSIARDMDIGDRLILPGTHKNPAVPLALMDVFLMTSRFEGTPNVLMEAQALGIPVVATSAGGVEETMLDGITGIVVRKRSPTVLADALEKVLSDHAWTMRAQKHGPELIASRFGLERMISETMKAYGFEERTETCSDLRGGSERVHSN